MNYRSFHFSVSAHVLVLPCVDQVEDALETLVSQPGKAGGEAEVTAAGKGRSCEFSYRHGTGMRR